MKRSKKIIFLIVGIVLILIIVAVAGGRKKRAEVVTTDTVSRRTLVETVSASGKIQPEIEVKISAEVSGMILELPVNEGEIVEAGQLLVGINPDLYESALGRTEAALNSAKSQLASAKARKMQAQAQLLAASRAWERSQQLFAQGAISQAEFDQAQSTFEVSQAEVEAAEQSIQSADFSIRSAEASRREALDNLKRTRLISPQRGTVTALTKEVGEAVLGTSMMQGETIMKISDLRTMEVNVEVNESDIVRVHVGDTASVEVDAFRDQTFLGIVTEIGNTALNAMDNMALNLNQVTNFGVKIRILPSSYAHLVSDSIGTSPFRPGMSATVDIRTSSATNVLSVPIKAVTTRADTTSRIGTASRREAETTEQKEDFICVFVLAEGKARLRVIETGVQDNKYMEVKSGLNEGDVIIDGPYDLVSRKLRNGAAVETESKSDEDDE
jgi:HlyD family secretion protein